MSEDFPLMPVIAGGPAAPLESSTQSSPQPNAQTGTLESAFKTDYYNSPVVNLLNRGIGEATDDTLVSYDDAVKSIKAQNLNPAFIPKDGMTHGALRREAERQSAVKMNTLRTQRAGGGGIVSNAAAGLGAGLADPSNIVLGPLAGEVMGMARGGLALRGAIGAGVGAAYTGGFAAGEAHLSGHDEDINSWSMLSNMTWGAAFGGLTHAAFGPRPSSTMPSGAAQAAIQNVLNVEGGLTNDTGGVTKFGISANAHPGVDIANLTPEAAANIYHKEYWNKINGDALPPEIQQTAMDAAVNQGVGNAKAWLKQSGGDVAKFNELRRAQYEKLAKDNPAKYRQYLKGWLARVDKIEGAAPARTEFGTAPAAIYDYEAVRNPQDAIDDAQTALSQFAADETVEPAATRQRIGPETVQGGYDEITDVYAQGTKAATPWEQRLAEYRAQNADPVAKLPPEEREQVQRLDAAPPPKEEATTEAPNLEAEDHKQYVADTKALFSNDPVAAERLDNAITDAHTAFEEGTNMKHDELTKTVEAAVKCGALKGVTYGVD